MEQKNETRVKFNNANGKATYMGMGSQKFLTQQGLEKKRTRV